MDTATNSFHYHSNKFIHTFHQKKDKLLMTLDYFECNSTEHKMCHYCIKMEFQKIVNFLGTTSDGKDLPRFVAKKWIGSL